MNPYEQLVILYLAEKERLFLCPQFSINHESSCPDVVAINFKEQEVQIIEVTSASNTKNIVEKIRNRQEQWIRPLRLDLDELKIPCTDFQFVVRAFLRGTEVEKVRGRFKGESDVRIDSIDRIALNWEWYDDQA